MKYLCTMHTITVSTLAQGHERAIKYIAEHGHVRLTEDGAMTIESRPITITVRDPLGQDRCSRFNPVGPAMCEQYAHDLVEGTAAAFEYDYHTRLFHYNSSEITTDQISYMIGKLRDAPTSRRAVAVTWQPRVDTVARDVPCLQLLKCMVWDGRLDMTAVFRSNDICVALGANMIGLTELQRRIATSIGVPVGEYVHISLSPHIYLSNIDDIRRFCMGSMEALHPSPDVCGICREETCVKRRIRAYELPRQ